MLVHNPEYDENLEESETNAKGIPHDFARLTFYTRDQKLSTKVPYDKVLNPGTDKETVVQKFKTIELFDNTTFDDVQIVREIARFANESF
jgi:hypothetical protein